MNNIIILRLKKKLGDLSAYESVQAETERNILKEELQFYVLNFIYHHPKYSQWVMYGGSALRICHGLDRMSVDLDFEVDHPVTDPFLNELKEEIEIYFLKTYAVDSAFLAIKKTGTRGLRLNFNVGESLGMSHPSKQVHVKIDLNYFKAPDTVVIERRPVSRDQFSFVIKTYNMSSLMASKIAAIFGRKQRGVGKAVYDEKGRDIYDLLWYMSKRVIPSLDYLLAKNIAIKDPRDLFDELTVKMSTVSDTNLKQDLTPLFTNQLFIENWLTNWRESYQNLLGGYKIYSIANLQWVRVHKDFDTGIFSFVYEYGTKEGKTVSIRYSISEYWMDDREGELETPIEAKLKKHVEFNRKSFGRRHLSGDKLMRYVTLFYEKNEGYFRKTRHIVLRDRMETKIIRMDANNLNPREQIVLSKSGLISSELEGLLK